MNGATTSPGQGRARGARAGLHGLLLAALALAGCATGASHASPAPLTPAAVRDGLGERLLRGYLQPRTRALTASTRDLLPAVRAYCGRPDAARRARAEQQLARVVDAWAGVELLRFGPLVEANRQEQFFFFPDPRGVVQRQLRALLAAADAAVLEPARLGQQSVAVQGLPALEYALHADEAERLIAAGEASGRYRCAYAEALAANLQRVAAGIEDGWRNDDALAREFIAPAATAKVYRSSGEVATETLKALSTALHAARDQKIAPALGTDATSARATLLPLHRSGLTGQFIAAGLGALDDFYAASRLGAALPADARWMDASLRDELRRAREDFTALGMPVAQALTDVEQRDRLVHAQLVLANARVIVDEYLAPALGVNLGFNSLDGD